MTSLETIRERYQAILQSVKAINQEAILISVSKTKPIEDLREAHDAGCRDFGENYVDEIITKAPQLPEARFYMIGHLQQNKVNKLCAIPNLAMIQTIDSARLASKVNNAWPTDRPPLDVLIQVNTSDEPQKHGINHSSREVIDLVRFLKSDCPRLRFQGLMTIGELGGGEKDFSCLIAVRDRIVREVEIDPKEIRLSMGMSGDYELALRMGATYVRVGTSIFGARNYGKAG
jgi:pyridoxal phosphate enzyme (YggS family)